MQDHHNQTKQLLEKIENLIEVEDFEQLKELLLSSRSSDVAEVVEVLDEIARQVLFDLLDPREAGEVLEKIDEATRSEVVEEMTNETLGNIVSSLPPDEAADVIADLSDVQTEQILYSISKKDSIQLEKLLSYEEDTAGGIMTPEVVKVRIDQTIRDAIRSYRKADHNEHFFYVYAVDHFGRYLGAVDIHTLLKYPRTTSISEIMDTEMPVIHHRDDQEVIANTFRKNDLVSAPVVDDNNILIGRITVDDIVDVMEEEAEEDVLRMAGTHPDELETRSTWRAALVRLPWLLICMTVGMTFSVVVYHFFQNEFNNPMLWGNLLVFVPAVAAIGGNSGMQTSTVVVRGLATGDLAALNIMQVYLRECKIAIIVAVCCSLISSLVSYTGMSVFSDSPARDVNTIGLSVGLAMLSAILLSTSLGLMLPFLFRKIGIDPAISSGPLITTINDIISSALYFSIGLTLMKHFA